MKRRDVLIAAAALAASGSPLSNVRAASADPAAQHGGKAPFRTLYNNDSTNLLSCYSPWSNPSNNSKPLRFSQRLIAASVAEVAGLVDVQLFCPGLCWVPWWQSTSVPAAAELAWYYGLFGKPGGRLDPYAQYMIDGGDMVRGFLDACRSHGQTAFVSFRLNDVQFLETNSSGKIVPTSKMSQFWYAHSAYASKEPYTLGTDYSRSPERAQNWAIPAVREYKLRFIDEICNYDIDGLELDFNRAANFFPAGSDVAENQAIMVDFVRRVRRALDRRRRRYLSVRVPSFIDVHPALGISLPAFVEAGVDMVNASDGYFTTNESDLALIRAMIPGTALYFETTQTTNLTALFSDGSRPFLRTTDQQFQTAADLAYRQGADGISVFNFAYYRQTIDENAADRGVGPFTEPPFHVLAGLRSPEYVASRPRWYVLAVDHNTYIAPSMQMPQTLHANESHTFELFLYPGVIGPEAILRVRVAPPTNYAGGEVPAWAAQVELNGTALDCIPFVEAPLADPYEANLAVDCSRFRCFKASSGIVREGQNLIKVTLVQPDPQSAANVALDYLDIAWP